jgi:resolvase-like protein
LQIDALRTAGCEKWFLDKITGTKAERKGLNEALAYLRPGDTLVVWKLDRAGRSLKHLMELLKGLDERDISFMSLTEQIDTTTPSGKLIFQKCAQRLGSLGPHSIDMSKQLNHPRNCQISTHGIPNLHLMPRRLVLQVFQ